MSLFCCSVRRLYDCLVSVLDEKDHDFGDIRRVLERGMRNGAVSLMKDVSRGEEQQDHLISWCSQGSQIAAQQ